MKPPLHKAADYYEPLFRARVRKAMKLVRTRVSINALAMSMGNHAQAANLIPRKEIEAALKPAMKVVTDAFNHGGKVGAAHVREVLK